MTAKTMIDRMQAYAGAKNQSRLAEVLCVDRALLCKAYHGKVDNFTMKTMQHFATALRLPIGQLAEWWAEEQPEQEQTA